MTLNDTETSKKLAGALSDNSLRNKNIEGIPQRNLISATVGGNSK